MTSVYGFCWKPLLPPTSLALNAVSVPWESSQCLPHLCPVLVLHACLFGVLVNTPPPLQLSAATRSQSLMSWCSWYAFECAVWSRSSSDTDGLWNFHRSADCTPRMSYSSSVQKKAQTSRLIQSTRNVWEADLSAATSIRADFNDRPARGFHSDIIGRYGLSQACSFWSYHFSPTTWLDVNQMQWILHIGSLIDVLIGWLRQIDRQLSLLAVKRCVRCEIHVTLSHVCLEALH